jgi:hypothetical protein
MSRNNFFAAAFSVAFVAGAARAQSDAANFDDLSALPVASASTTTLPTICAGSGTTFRVEGVQAGAFAIIYTMERLSDGARVTVEVGTRGAQRQQLPAAGTVVHGRTVSTGVVLTAAGRAIAYVPNALGRAVLRNRLLAA